MVFKAHAAEAPVTYTRFCASCGISDIESFVSHSGQFIVHSAVIRGFVPRATGTNALKYITAEPQLIALMGERVSRGLSQELQVPMQYRDKVHATVFNWAPVGQAIGLITQVHSDGFLYKMIVPGQVEGPMLFKGVLQALILEFANRDHNRSGELPNWVVEGMVRQIQTTAIPTYIVNKKPITIETAGYDRLGNTRAYFQTNTPLTLQDFSFANLNKVTPEQRQQFEASSHLLVHQLLKLKNGPQLFAKFLQTLPTTLNWQTAFYSVYKQHFTGPLQFEKWWMLNWVQFKNSQDRELWSLDVTLDRLESVLYTTMEVRAETNSIPLYRDTSLQEFIQIADFTMQREILSQKVQHMSFMSLNVPEKAVKLWNGYIQVLDSYLQRRGNDTQPTLKSEPGQRLQSLLKSTLKTLNELDAARAELKVGGQPVIPTEEPENRQASR
ncbi:MAG TPA: hypothetical protein VM735_06800 [Candidatus Kapabacteria bacterium]|nr:hypothetical protein [Candidatus Kapabacteria bacterium]